MNENEEDTLLVTEVARTYYKRYKIVWSEVDEGEWAKKGCKGYANICLRKIYNQKVTEEVKERLRYWVDYEWEILRTRYQGNKRHREGHNLFETVKHHFPE